MPSTYNGNSAGITARLQVDISEPVGIDVRNSASVRTPLERLANFLQYLMQKAGLIDVVSTWTAKQAFNAGLTSGLVPSAGTDVVRKTELDAEASTRAAAVSSEASARATGDTTTLATAEAYTNTVLGGGRVIACANAGGASSGMSAGSFGFTDCTRSGTGSYSLTPSSALPSGAVAIATCRLSGRIAAAFISGGSIIVSTYLHDGTAQDTNFGVMVLSGS